MSTIVSLLFLLVFLATGFIAGRLRILVESRGLDLFFSVVLYLLLLSMGLRLGQSRDVLSRLPEIGALAAAAAVSATLGTLLLQALAAPLYRRMPGFSVPERQGNGGRRLSLLLENLKKPFFLLVFVVLGGFIGVALPPLALLQDGSVSTWILYALLFVIGVKMATDGHGLRAMLLSPSTLVLPSLTIAGTLAGSLVLIPLFGLTPGKALAMGSGFGWYSLSGVLIADRGAPVLGAAAFLANLLRETLAFLLVPALRAGGRHESGVGICGATSMDVTLPVLEDAWGPGVVPVAVAHGVLLSFLVPFLVPLFMSF